jgi:GT2 family glycosyltransferase
LYFDEDQYDPRSGYRFSPWFKPSILSPDLLISVNYLRHAVIRKTTLAVGKLPFSFDEFREWEMTLRITEQSSKMKHIPKVLYHQAQTEQIDRQAEFPESAQWMSRAIQEHLSRKSIENTRVTLQRNAVVHVRYPTYNVLASIIIPNKNRLSYIEPCITSILEKTRYPNYEIVLVDNQSDDPAVHAYYESLSKEPRINVLSYPHPFNFHALNNWAVRQSKGEVLIFLNNDTEVLEPDWLEEMVGCAMRPDVGMVGAKLLRPNGKIQHVGMIIGLMGHAADIFEDCEDHLHTCFGSVDWYRDYHAVTGACIAIRRKVFVRLGGFDEIYEVGYGDIDLCLRAHQQGYRIVYTPFAVLRHHEGGTRKFWLPRSDILRATIKMWSAVEGGDGYFNPNLSYHSRVPTFAGHEEESRPARLLRILQEFALVEGGASLLPPEISMPHDR